MQHCFPAAFPTGFPAVVCFPPCCVSLILRSYYVLQRAVEPVHMVFAGVYPTDGADYEVLADAIRKLMLSDTSLTQEKESSVALGLGFRVGFLGALHMEVFHERLAQVCLPAPRAELT